LGKYDLGSSKKEPENHVRDLGDLIVGKLRGDGGASIIERSGPKISLAMI
jgi:hypothetical protein